MGQSKKNLSWAGDWEVVRKTEGNVNELTSGIQNTSAAAQKNKATAVPPRGKLGSFQVKPYHTL